jgi:hypothetical protein
MIIALLMALAVLFGGLVLVSLYVGRKYEIRHRVGELDEDFTENEQHVKPTDESNSKENL